MVFFHGFFHGFWHPRIPSNHRLRRSPVSSPDKPSAARSRKALVFGRLAKARRTRHTAARSSAPMGELRGMKGKSWNICRKPWVFYGKSWVLYGFFPLRLMVSCTFFNLKPTQRIFTQEIPAIFWMGISSNFLDGASLTRMAI